MNKMQILNYIKKEKLPFTRKGPKWNIDPNDFAWKTLPNHRYYRVRKVVQPFNKIPALI